MAETKTKAKTARAKTKTTRATVKPAKPVEPPKVEAPPPPPTSESVFQLLTWKGKPLYQCRLCPFNVVDNERAFWLHYAQNHLPKINPPEPSGLIGPDGKPLTKEV